MRSLFKPSPKTKFSGRGRGSLMLIVLFLLASASIRIGIGAGQAFAKESTLETPQDVETQTLQSCKSPDELRAVIVALQQREDRLKRRETDMRDRLHALNITDEKVGLKLSELIIAEEKLRSTIALADSAAETDLSRLTKVYETMKPKDAAALFEEMDPQFAAGFIGRMKPEFAAGVMTGLSPVSAYTISVILAGRNADVPTN